MSRPKTKKVSHKTKPRKPVQKKEEKPLSTAAQAFRVQISRPMRFLQLLGKILLGIFTIYAAYRIFQIWQIKNEIRFESDVTVIFVGTLRIIVYLLWLGVVWLWVNFYGSLVERYDSYRLNILFKIILTILSLLACAAIQYWVLDLFMDLNGQLPLIG